MIFAVNLRRTEMRRSSLECVSTKPLATRATSTLGRYLRAKER